MATSTIILNDKTAAAPTIEKVRAELKKINAENAAGALAVFLNEELAKAREADDVFARLRFATVGCWPRSRELLRFDLMARARPVQS